MQFWSDQIVDMCLALRTKEFETDLSSARNLPWRTLRLFELGASNISRVGDSKWFTDSVLNLFKVMSHVSFECFVNLRNFSYLIIKVQLEICKKCRGGKNSLRYVDRVRRNAAARCLLLTGANLHLVVLSCFVHQLSGNMGSASMERPWISSKIKISTKIKALRLWSDSLFYEGFLSKSYTCWMFLHRLPTGTKLLHHCNPEEADQNVRKKHERAVPSLLSVQNSLSIMLP